VKQLKFNVQQHLSEYPLQKVLWLIQPICSKIWGGSCTPDINLKLQVRTLSFIIYHLSSLTPHYAVASAWCNNYYDAKTEVWFNLVPRYLYRGNYPESTWGWS